MPFQCEDCLSHIPYPLSDWYGACARLPLVRAGVARVVVCAGGFSLHSDEWNGKFIFIPIHLKIKK